MHLFKNILLILVPCSLWTCGQPSHPHETITQMEYNKISHATVKAAIEAWQKADATSWLSLFTRGAGPLDDGHPRDFNKFSTEVIGQERFITIDKVEDNGLSVYGRFHSDTWGDFKTYFKFHLGKRSIRQTGNWPGKLLKFVN